MGSTIDRKRFLHLSSLGVIGALLPTQSVKALQLAIQTSTYDPQNFVLAMDKAKIAKAHFFRKEFAMAESLYLECINLAPASIRFYDNLQSVYSAQGKYLETAILFKNGLERNQQKIAFFDRLAKCLMRLETGNRKVSDQYKTAHSSTSLLQDAKSLYQEALIIDPEKNYLRIGLRKVKKKIEEDAVNKDYRVDRARKDKKNRRRKRHNQRYRSFSVAELESKLLQINEKQRNILLSAEEVTAMNASIQAEKKRIYRVLIKRKIKDKEYTSAIDFANQLYNLDKTDSYAIGKLSRLFRKNGKHTEYVNLRREFSEVNQRVWSYIGLMKAINLAYKKDGPQ